MSSPEVPVSKSLIMDWLLSAGQTVSKTDRATLIHLSIGPTEAKMLLGLRPTYQRSINRARVAKYAADMASGNYIVDNGQSIVVSSRFDLVDGQHRCLAIVESGATLGPFVVVIRHVDDGGESTIDMGWGRTLHHVMKIGQKRGAGLSPSRKAAIVWEHCGFDRRKKLSLSKTEASTIIEESDMVDVVQSIPNGPAGVLAVFLAAYRLAPEDATAFFTAALNGDHEVRAGGGSVPALKYLVKWLIESKRDNNTGEAFARECVYRAIVSWNAFRTGRGMKQMPRYNGISTPLPTLA